MHLKVAKQRCSIVQDKGTIQDLVWAAKRTFGKQSVMAAYDFAAVTVVHNQDQPVSSS